MPLTNAEKQARHRERLRKKGLILFHAWVTPEQARIFHESLTRQLHVTMPAVRQLQVTRAVPMKKKARSPDPVWQQNQLIVKLHLAEIASRRRQGHGPTAVAAWLSEEFGFEGTGATLNGFLPDKLRRLPRTNTGK